MNRADLAGDLAALALRVDPAAQGGHCIMAAALEAQGRHGEALMHWREAARLAPRSRRDRFNLALALLAHDDFATGWPLYEERLDSPTWTPWASRASIADHRDRKLRPGDAVEGRDIVVFTEQGLGDNMMFARYLPLLAQRGARVTLACQPVLRPIFERIAGIHHLLSPPPDRPDGKLNLSALHFDAFAPLMSLPQIFGTTPETVPVGLPYLLPDPARVAAWRARYEAAGRPGRRRIGLVMQANPASESAQARSMRLEDIAPLIAIDGIDIVNLQAGVAGRAIGSESGVIDAMSMPQPLDEFAAAIAATDRLLAVDTMASHCAGAMAHPVWVALPVDSAWHWGLERSSSRWYPHARLFRQMHRGVWDDVIGSWTAALRD
jgi:hypothetical protein